MIVNLVNVKLTWEDRANNEEGFRVYRDGTLLISLAPDSASYEDNTTLAVIWLIGDPKPSHIYSVESYNSAGKSASKEIKIECP